MNWMQIVVNTLGDFGSGAASGAGARAGDEAMSKGIALLSDDPQDGLQPGGDLTGGDHTQELIDATKLDIGAALLSLDTAHLRFSSDKDENYEGDMRGDEPHGRGTYTYVNDDRHLTYVGDWKKGVPHGRGVLKGSEHRYAGDWKDGVPHGRGVFISTWGRYDGDWIDGKPFT